MCYLFTGIIVSDNKSHESYFMRLLFTLVLLIACTLAFSQDTILLKVHFLYGSKPLKKYKGTEKKWFGGMLGGHVGIEGDNDKVFNFQPKGRVHWFAHKHNLHSYYGKLSVIAFDTVMGGNTDSVKTATVDIPITRQQKQTFDSICLVYIKQTPYDYAFLGMRCSAAAYDVLAQLGILKRYSYRRTYLKIFYPKKLRKILFKEAAENGWVIERKEGSPKRKWEAD